MYQAVIAIRTTTKKSQCHTAINIFSHSQNGRSSVVQQIWAQLGRWVSVSRSLPHTSFWQVDTCFSPGESEMET